MRTESSNTRLIEALALLAPPDVEVVVWRGLAGLPHFNPDLDGAAPPQSVLALRREVGLADGMILCSPEYAHGVAGTMKNALDWLVASLEFAGMPVALVNTAPRAVHAQSHMRETLQTMAARYIENASIAVPIQGARLTAAQIADDPALSGLLRDLLATFVDAIGVAA